MGVLFLCLHGIDLLTGSLQTGTDRILAPDSSILSEDVKGWHASRGCGNGSRLMFVKTVSDIGIISQFSSFSFATPLMGFVLILLNTLLLKVRSL